MLWFVLGLALLFVSGSLALLVSLMMIDSSAPKEMGIVAAIVLPLFG